MNIHWPWKPLSKELPRHRKYRRLGKNLDELLSHRGAVSDHDLVSALEWRIAQKMDPYGVGDVTLAERRFVAMHRLGLVIFAEGLAHYFENSDGDDSELALEFFEEIGAFKTAGILRRAMEVFPDKVPPMKWDERIAEIKTLPSEARSIWYECEDEFSNCEEDVEGLAMKYVEEHRDEFQFDGA
jgi:hypothetical protein